MRKPRATREEADEAFYGSGDRTRAARPSGLGVSDLLLVSRYGFAIRTFPCSRAAISQHIARGVQERLRAAGRDVTVTATVSVGPEVSWRSLSILESGKFPPSRLSFILRLVLRQ